MKNVFVVLPFGISNALVLAQHIVHLVEMKLDTYCQLIPNLNLPLSFWVHNELKPLDYLRHCLAYMTEADVVVFEHDWQSFRECSLLHAIAAAYELNILVLDAPKEEQEIKFLPCPFCGEDDMLSVAYHETKQGKEFFVTCTDCGTDGPMANSAQEAVELWNNREAKNEDRHG